MTDPTDRAKLGSVLLDLVRLNHNIVMGISHEEVDRDGDGVAEWEWNVPDLPDIDAVAGDWSDDDINQIAARLCPEDSANVAAALAAFRAVKTAAAGWKETPWGGKRDAESDAALNAFFKYANRIARLAYEPLTKEDR